MRNRCRCGTVRCASHNRCYYYRRTDKIGKPGQRTVRASVWRWDERKYRRGNPVWSWCPVLNGDPIDDASSLGHYDSQELAYADAMAWVAGRYGTEREASDG